MTMTTSHGRYTTAVGSLDWLDVGYGPQQLTEKYKLPTLVRIGEGHYGNADDTCFSAMDVIKLHGVQRVDMVIAEVKTDHATDEPDCTSPTRICLPIDFPGFFDASLAESNADKPDKLFKSVRLLADQPPQCVMVMKKPKKVNCIEKGEILETIGLTICSGMWEEQGLWCRRRDESKEDLVLNLKWKGHYRSVPDPDGYTLAQIQTCFKFPLTVTLRSPRPKYPHQSSLNRLLPYLERPLVLDREITTEFLVGTTIGAGLWSTVPEGRESGLRKDHGRADQNQQSAIIVLSMNANVCFQICQDMVHRRVTYTSLLEMFGECSMDKLPIDLFISEYAAPFVTFMRTDVISPPTAVGRRPDMFQRVQSRSTPNLSLAEKLNQDDESQADTNHVVGHDYAYLEREELSKRALPPLPSHQPTPPGIAVDNELARSQAAENGNKEVDNKIGLLVNIGTADRAQLKSVSRDHLNRRTYHPQIPYKEPSVPQPPPGFTSQECIMGDDVEASFEDQTATDQQVRCQGSDSRERLPNRRPPPPPRRTTPQRPGQETMYANLGSELPPPLDAPQSPPTVKATPSSRPPEVLPRRSTIKGSQSLNINQGRPLGRLHPDSVFNTLPVRCRLRNSPHCDGASSRALSTMQEPNVGYLQPRKTTVLDSPRNVMKSASVRSNSTGMMLENVNFTYLTPNKDLSLSESSLQTSRQESKQSINVIEDIPLDISDLSTSDLVQCLILLKLDSQIIERVERNQINGSLLGKLSSSTIKNELALSDFEAEKVDAFRHGWRPDSEKS